GRRVPVFSVRERAEVLDAADRGPPRFAIDAVGVRNAQHRLTLRPEFDSLVDARQEAGPPARLPGARLAARQQDHVRRQVAVAAAKAADDPGAHARTPELFVTCGHE